ncbi:MAG: toxin-antitoxin system YwqK family antitoxin [Planctomycetota bacterium]
MLAMRANSSRTHAAHRALVAAFLVSAGSLVACRYETGLSRPLPGATRTALPGEPLRVETRKKTDPATGRVVHEWSVLHLDGHSPVKHGRETVWSANGVKLWEREYDRGKPHGVWRSYYSDGAPNTESFFGDPNVATQMSFWYPNGKLRMQGPAQNGVRNGRWRIWYDDGSLAEEGDFAGSFREGEWQVRSKDGSTCSIVVYERNVRVENRSVSCDELGPTRDV